MSDCTRTEERLIEALEKTSGAAELAALDAHLAECSACRETAQAFRAIRLAYLDVPEADVDASIADAVLARAAEASTAPPLSRRATFLLAAAAAVLLATWVTRIVAAPVDAPAEDPVAERILEGDRARDAAELDRAIHHYERAARLEGDRSRAAQILHRLGEAYLAAEEYARAEEHLGVVLDRHPDYAERRTVLLLRGEALEGLGEVGRALQAYRLFAHEYPADPEIMRRVDVLERSVHEGVEMLEALGYTE